MAAKKPRKIKDLKARLGRTIAPNTQQGDGAVAPPPGVGAQPAAKPKPAAAPGDVVPPAVSKPAAPGIVAPPFAKPKPKPAPAAVDPFGSPGAVSQATKAQEVRLVFDDKPVEDEEVGRKRKAKTLMLLGIGALLGLVLGYLSGSVMNDRRIHNMAVRDGKDLYAAVQEATNTVSEAQRLTDEAVRAARGAPGKAPAVDYASIEALRGLEKPFTANVFSRKNYGLFRTDVVDAMFDYYNHINQVWGRIEAVSAMTTGDTRRQELDASAASMENATALIGCLVSVADSRYQCNLGFVRLPEEGEEVEEPGNIFIRASQRARREAQKALWVGAEDADLSSGNFVLLINNQQSMGVLGEQSNLFAEYVREISSMKALIDETAELQGRVETGLGEVASNAELFTF